MDTEGTNQKLCRRTCNRAKRICKGVLVNPSPNHQSMNTYILPFFFLVGSESAVVETIQRFSPGASQKDTESCDETSHLGVVTQRWY